MTKYVALLRAINVGGNNIIKMDALRAEFEKLGFKSVSTYIQSGNVLFDSAEKDSRKIEVKLEKALAAKFKYSAKVLIRSKEEMEKTVNDFPKIFKNDEWKHNVIFTSDDLDPNEFVKSQNVDKQIELIATSTKVIYWSARIDTITKSKMLKLSQKKEFKEMTVRNVNTTVKIPELMK